MTGNPFPATARQIELLRYIVGYRQAFGFSPEYTEMATAIDSHPSAVNRLLNCLEERQHIRRSFGVPRGVEVLSPLPIPFAPDGAPLYLVRGPWSFEDGDT